jgi:DNA-binding CsgD family transcriptional regulator
MPDFSDLLDSLSPTCNVSNQDYNELGAMIETLDAMSRVTLQSFYVIDYFKNDFMYVSDNPLFFCDCPSEQFKNIGYQFYVEHIPKHEQKLLLKIRTSVLSFFNNTTGINRLEYTVSYNFHVNVDDKQILINHKHTPIRLDKDGNVWLALCTISLSSHDSCGHILINRSGTNESWECLPNSTKWVKVKPIELNNKEKEIIALSIQGYTMMEISNKLFICLDTVKFHKKTLFEKMDVKNISEAIIFAMNYKLL